jgi:DNA-binding MarR family transcriptional regulator
MTMTDIARKMGHSTAAATGLVDRMEKLGYLERTHALEDRRKVMVRVTAKGNELVNQLRGSLAQLVANAMQETSSTDAASFLTNFPSAAKTA